MLVLEQSTNTHKSLSEGVSVTKEISKMNTIVLETKGNLIVEHGHHFTVATEKDTNDLIKITQQEVDPISKAYQNAFD